MAGDWIKLRTDLQTDPAVIRLASLLGLDTFGVIGRLTTVWVWADTHADRHGHVTLVSRSCLDSIAQCDGFGAALESVGWLQSSPPDDGGITFPRFERHMGEGAKARAQAAKRKQKQRAGESRSGHADVPKASRTQRDTSVTREEKRRREKKEEEKTPLPPADAGDGVGGPDPEPTPAPETNPEPEPAPGVGPNPQAVAEHWNTHPGLVPCVASDPHRDRIVRSWATGNALWAAHWRAVIAFMGRTPLYCGGGQQQWRATVGWLLKNDNFTTVVERMLAEGSPPRALPGPVPPLKPVKETSAGAVARIIAQANTKTITPERPCTTPSTAPTGSPLGSATTVRRSA